MRYFYFLGLLLFFLALGMASLWLVQNNTPLTIVWLGYEIRTSVAFLGLSLFTLTTVLVFVGFGLLWLVSLPSRTFSLWSHKRTDHGLELLTQGFIAFSSGEHEEALKLTHRAAKRLTDQPILPTILAAEIARQSGDVLTMKRHYTALLNHKQTEFIGLKGLMAQSQKEKDFGDVLSLGLKAKKLKPKDIPVSAMLFRAYKEQKRWHEAELELDELVKGLKKEPEEQQKLIRDSSHGDFSRQKGLLLFQRAREAHSHGQVKEAFGMVLHAIKYIPDFSPLYILAAQIAPEARGVRKIRKLIEELWKVKPHPDLTRAYDTLFAGENAEKRLKLHERLYELNPDFVESHRIVATAAIAAGDITKARNHVKAALAIEETASLCQLMAHLAKVDNDLEQAESWRNRATLATPDHFWVCGQCNFHTLNWDIFCSSCGTWDSYRWDMPHSGGYHFNADQEALLLTNIVDAPRSRDDGLRAWKNPYAGES